MSRFFYDLHIHSCLSPCADDDMTPANIAGMAHLQGLNLVALTDHNTTRNCPAFFRHAPEYGIVPVAGMELTTSEEIHVLCLFPTLEAAMDFNREVSSRRILIHNRPEIFGHQYVMDEEDEVAEEEPDLLINATSLDLEQAFELADSHGGVCYPAHVDRDSGGMIAVLGDLPDRPKYRSFELNDKENLSAYREQFPKLRDKNFLISSDAHHLWLLSEAVNGLELPVPGPDDDTFSADEVRQALINHLKGV